MNATGDHGGEVQGDVTPSTRWMTYRELADLLRVEEESGRRRAQRARWPRRPGNDGKTRVGVPDDVASDDTRNAARDDAGNDTGDVTPAHITPALVALTERQVAELANQRERAARAEGEAAALRDALAREVGRADRADITRQGAEDERDNLATEIIKERERRARAEGELAGLRTALQQLEGRAERADTAAAGHRDTAAQAAAQAATERAARQSAEASWQAAEAELDRARGELAEWTGGGPLARAWRAFLHRRGRP